MTKETLKIGLIIPVFNVEKTILRVLEALTPDIMEHIQEVLLIDNCSQDRTVPLIDEHMQRHPAFAARATLLLHHANYGYGTSIKRGFTHFLSRPVEHVILIHSDYQVDPHWLISELIGHLRADESLDLVMASRFMRGSDTSDYSLLRRFGNHLFNVITWCCSGLHLSDSGAAMMLIRKDRLAVTSFSHLSPGLQFHPQLNLLLYGAPTIKIREFPMRWMDSDAPSSLSLFGYGWTLLKMLLWYRVARTLLRMRPEHIFQHETITPEQGFRVRNWLS